MSKFTLKPKQSFSSIVSIPRAGHKDNGELSVVFRHKRLSDIEALEKLMREKIAEMQAQDEVNLNGPCADYLMSIMESWDLPDEMSRDNVIELLDNYPRAFDAIALNYTRQVMCSPEHPTMQ